MYENKISNKVKFIISCILIVIIILCLYKIIYKQYEYHIANEQTQKVQHVMNLNSENMKEHSFFNKTEINKIINNENKLKSINKDYQGWLIVNGTDVNYPVVQTDNDSYYLHHSFYNEKSIEGNPFIYDKTNVDS